MLGEVAVGPGSFSRTGESRAAFPVRLLISVSRERLGDC